LIVLKIALVNEIFPSLRIQALLLVPAAGRWSMVCAAYFCPYARQVDGFGKAFVENCGLRELVMATFIFISGTLIFMRLQFLVLIIPLLFFMFICFSWLKKRIGGVTGDVLGGLNETAEVVSLAAFLFVK
jgi:adenosylcobinamide-GDP ribazoletransferase